MGKVANERHRTGSPVETYRQRVRSAIYPAVEKACEEMHSSGMVFYGGRWCPSEELEKAADEAGRKRREFRFIAAVAFLSGFVFLLLLLLVMKALI